MEKAITFKATFHKKVFKFASLENLTHVLISANEDNSRPIDLRWFTSEQLAKSYLSGLRQTIAELRKRKIAVGDQVHHILEVTPT